MTVETAIQDFELRSESSAKMQRKRILRRPKARSKVTNGQKLMLGDVDERSQFARRLRDILALHVSDLSGGAGGEVLSEAQLSLIRRASVLELRLEEMEMKMALGESVDIDVYARVAGHVRRLFETLGLRRVAKDITPRLHSYVAKQVAREQQQDDKQ